MDLTSIFLFCLMSVVIGAVLMLLIQYYAFVQYCNLPEESAEQKTINEKYCLPENILASMKSISPESKYPIVGLNLIMQFLFHELKYSNKVRKWFYRKLSLELDELITKTTTGKLFDKLTIRDLDLGGQFPELKNLRVHSAELHDTEGHIENLDLLLDLQYKGNFRLSIDADMVLGKKGSLTLKVKHLSGLARLQFTRKPYTHWSLSFLGDPQLDLGIESQFQGRQMQSNVTSLILNQIRKAVRRKHTLPNYKLRYKPFFHKTEEEIDTEMVPNGKLEVKVSELTRLMIPANVTQIYCTLTLASLPWVEAKQRDDQNIIISIDKEIHKAKNQQIGIVFKQNENSVYIEAVLPNTPAVKADLRTGDILILIEGKRVTSISQVAKIVKSLNRPVFSFRIERVCQGTIHNDAILEELEMSRNLSDFNIIFSKSTDSVQMVGIASKSNRKSSIEKSVSVDATTPGTPSGSPRKSQSRARSLTKNLSRESSDSPGQSPGSDERSQSLDTKGRISISSPINSKLLSSGKEKLRTDASMVEIIQQHSTVDCPVDTFVRMDDLCCFDLNENSIFLNVCVYGRTVANSCLLGYINVPINNVLVECGETNLGHHLKSFSLLPPHSPDLQTHPLSLQSGFDPYLCYGDILFSFVWTGSPTAISASNDKKSKANRSSTDKLEESEKIEAETTKAHNFVRTHFHRTTQCDFCGRKIWLKDAVQCRDCSMCCHKKCVTKCQNSTVCGPVDCAAMTNTIPPTTHPEFKLTEAPTSETYDYDDNIEEQAQMRLDTHRQSFSDLLAQGLKRVNSANNLAIPGVVSSLNQSSRSLPPSPQHTPRKQSLVNQNTNPFMTVTQKLESIPNDVQELTREQIEDLTDTLIGLAKLDQMMSIAKTASKSLYVDYEPNERVEKINVLLTKLRIALDSETFLHASLINTEPSSTSKSTATPATESDNLIDSMRPPSDVNLFLQTKPASSSPSGAGTSASANGTGSTSECTKKQQREQEHEAARKAILIAQSEERVQVLSVIMLYLCTGLQHAQGVACQ